MIKSSFFYLSLYLYNLKTTLFFLPPITLSNLTIKKKHPNDGSIKISHQFLNKHESKTKHFQRLEEESSLKAYFFLKKVFNNKNKRRSSQVSGDHRIHAYADDSKYNDKNKDANLKKHCSLAVSDQNSVDG